MHAKTFLPSFFTLSLFIPPIFCQYRPTNTSICDYYTEALLKENNADNQYALIVKLVNTVVIGNYTQPNKGVAVSGILSPGTVNGTNVALLPYFNGGLASSNRGGNTGVAINFLDGGAAAPLKMDKPASSEDTAQYKLLTHLYQFFGVLLGCSYVGDKAFPSYSGQSSMYRVHKFMDLSSHQVGYFVMQVGLAASSFGVAPADIAAVAQSLTDLFGYRCAPEVEVVKGQGKELQSICVTEDCPEAKDPVCDEYPKVEKPKVSNGTIGANHTVSIGTPSMTMSTEPTGTESHTPAHAAGTTIGALGRNAAGGLVLAVAWAVIMGTF